MASESATAVACCHSFPSDDVSQKIWCVDDRILHHAVVLPAVIVSTVIGPTRMLSYLNWMLVPDCSTRTPLPLLSATSRYAYTPGMAGPWTTCTTTWQSY